MRNLVKYPVDKNELIGFINEELREYNDLEPNMIPVGGMKGVYLELIKGLIENGPDKYDIVKRQYQRCWRCGEIHEGVDANWCPQQPGEAANCVPLE